MGAPREAPPAKLFMGIMVKPDAPVQDCIETLKESYGPVDETSGRFSFDHSDYYRSEMGPFLEKFFLSFGPLVPQDRLAKIKVRTNTIETMCAVGEGRRVINLDPGILTLSNVILATTKGYAHRIYMEEGVFEEVTLIYRNGRYEPLPWTYPDYRQDECQRFMKKLRDIYHEQLKALQTERRNA